MSVNFVRFVGQFFAGLALLCTFATSASAAQWTRSCQGAAGSETEQCVVQQSVSVGREVVMVASFGTPGQKGVPTGTITVPLNTVLKTGISIDVDGTTETVLPIDFCGRQGCRSTFAVSAPLLKALLTGKALQTSWRGIDGKVVKLQFDLTGFQVGWVSVARKQ
jgi:invasion protein IalB